MRLLTVGTDCAVGKKYTALALEREMLARGMKATYRATGQTGIMIAGSGIPIDAVVADFVAGAAEMLSPDNEPDHWDLIEGQGALHHPGYAGVSLGLLHGSQPDAFVVCHEAGRTGIDLWDGFPVPGVCGVHRDKPAAGPADEPGDPMRRDQPQYLEGRAGRARSDVWMRSFERPDCPVSILWSKALAQSSIC